VHRVVLLVNGLPKQEELVAIGNDEQRAHRAVAIHIPNVVFGLYRDVVLAKHELQWLEKVPLIAVNKCSARAHCVLGLITRCFNDGFNYGLVVQRRYHEVRTTSVENCIRGPINGILKGVGKLDCLAVS